MGWSLEIIVIGKLFVHGPNKPIQICDSPMQVTKGNFVKWKHSRHLESSLIIRISTETESPCSQVY